jgi:hypothetical protein
MLQYLIVHVIPTNIKYIQKRLHTYQITRNQNKQKKPINAKYRNTNTTQLYVRNPITPTKTKHTLRSKTPKVKMGNIYILWERSKTNSHAF